MDWNLSLSGSGDGQGARASFASFIGHLRDNGHTVHTGGFSTSETVDDLADLQPAAVDPAAQAVTS